MFQRPQHLLQCLGEVASDRHRFANTLHVRGQRLVGMRELLEREPGNLHDDVVERRLERRRRLGRDVVGNLVEGVADGELVAIFAMGNPVALLARALIAKRGDSSR